MLLPSPTFLTEPLVIHARGIHILRLSALPAWLLGLGRREQAIGQKASQQSLTRHFGLSLVLGGRMDWCDLPAEGLDQCSRLYSRHYRFSTWHVRPYPGTTLYSIIHQLFHTKMEVYTKPTPRAPVSPHLPRLDW